MVKCTVNDKMYCPVHHWGGVWEVEPPDGLSGLLLLRRVGRKGMGGVLVLLPGEEKKDVGGMQYYLLLQCHNRDQLADIILVDQVNYQYQTAASAPPAMT